MNSLPTTFVHMSSNDETIVLWKYDYGGLRLINSRSHGEVNEPPKGIRIINDEIVQKTIVGHESGVTMMSSCRISKTFVKEVTCMAFPVLELKVVANKS